MTNFKCIIMNEKILCACVWYKDLEKIIDIPPSVFLPTNIDKGIIFCGFRHGQCIYTACAITGLKQSESGESVQGFLTSKNRFVTREEALQIALKENQVINIDEIRGDRLFSEDLY